MVKSVNNKLDKLLSDISNIQEVNRADELAYHLLKKYGDLFTIDEHKSDIYVLELIDSLEELSNIANLISLSFKNELSL